MKGNMKTIAVTIDAETLDAVDRIGSGPAKSGHARSRGNRSAIVRAALRRYVEARVREEQEEHDRRVFARHRKKLERQARALVAEQAAP